MLIPYKKSFPQLAGDVFVAPGAWVIGDVVIGERSSVWFNTVIRADVHYIRIGCETNIQDNCSLHVTEGKFPLELGSRITIGHRATVHGCTVEDDCLIGMGAVILDGARIGKESLVAAGAVVTPGFVVPPGSMVMGAPATVVRPLKEEELQMIRDAAFHYVTLSKEYMDYPKSEHAKKVMGFTPV